MQNPTPRIPQQPAPNHRAEYDGGLTDELAAVVTSARRRALRDGDRQIDTAHLLHSLIESDPAVRAAFDGGPQLARVLGYLVQRSIGYGLRWQGAVEDSGTVPLVTDAGAEGWSPSAEGWSPSAASAMADAVRRAQAYGRERAGGLDLLAALAADRESRAVKVLARAGVDPALLADRIVEAPGQA
ncbi:Clp protease N-terminal domain-containing protein [Streptomyces poriferorum]|uniref:Clp protease N-terminal domain-containing protein n=1 Tax=Streptomyces poriferorum TaxID=2798799 RepID=UPI00273CF9C7|nr:Clp protease N-terminal domain-containing protein [Streptomyces sp. Alt1]WLQ47031.1 Clp protease N-terminal domain-containing protein [Streptomyces sp. Alt1]